MPRQSKRLVASYGLVIAVALAAACRSRGFNRDSKSDSSFHDGPVRGVPVVGKPDPRAFPREEGPLSELRGGIVLPHLDEVERTRIVEQALLLLRDVYVNTNEKRKRYGDAVWAVPRLLDLQRKMATVDDVSFQESLIDIFTSQRDLHLNYYLPAPYSCYRSWLPFTLTKTQEKDGTFAVRVSAVMTSAAWKPELSARIAAAQEGVGVGAKVESYEGINVFDAIRGVAPLSAGSAVDPRETVSLRLLQARRGRSGFLPAKDSVRIVFRTPEGRLIERDFPWFVTANTQCLDEAAALFDEKAPDAAASDRGVARLPGARTPSRPRPSSSSYTPPGLLDDAEPSVPPRRLATVELQPTRDPILSFARLTRGSSTPSDDVGYIVLRSFVPGALTGASFVEAFSDVLLGLADTKGLLIDLRGNGGGNIALAEQLSQLLTPDAVQLPRWRLLNSPTNRAIASTRPWMAGWAPLVARTLPSAPFVEGGAFSTPAEMEEIGQGYAGPLTVLVNPSCYSACDAFASVLQDNRAAVIWGETGWQTGGGGANVVEHSEFVEPDSARGSPSGLGFAALPKGTGMRVSFRQLVRAGANVGKILEDEGVRADRVVYRTMEDFPLGSDARVLASLTQELRERAARRPAQPVIFAGALATSTQVDFAAASPLSLTFAAPESAIIKAHLDGETKNVAVEKLSTSSGRASYRLTAPAPGLTGRLLAVDATNARGDQVARIRRRLRGIPKYEKLAIGTALTSTAGDAANGLVVYSHGSGGGWIRVGPVLKTNATAEYTGSFETRASLFVKLPAGSRPVFRFEVEGASEADFDFLTIEARSEGKSTTIPLQRVGSAEKHEEGRLSGVLERGTWEADLTAFAGKDTEVSIAFLSDEMVTASGFTVHGWSLEILRGE